MKKIKVSTPGKLMLFGEHSVVYDKPCIVAAVDQRFEVIVEKLEKQEIIVEASGVGLKFYRKSLKELGGKRVPKGIRFVEAVVCQFFEKYGNGHGLRIETRNHFDSKYGFGSSAAVTVGLAKALHELFEIKISEKKLFDFCYKVVLKVQGIGSGFDIAAVLFGGVLYFVTGGKRIEPIFQGSELKRSSELLPMVVGYTGIKADTPTLVRQVAELKRQHPRKINKIFKEITFIVDKAKELLPRGKWKELGKLMNENQQWLHELGVSSVELDKMIEVSIEAGGEGAKLSGAGGGDNMIVLVDERKRELVAKAIEVAGGEVMKVKLGAEGVRIEQ